MRFRAALLIGSFLVLAHFSAAHAGDKPPFTEEATTITTFDGVTLSAKWTVPASPARAVAVIFQGSGNVGLDGDVSSPLVGSGYRGAPAKLSDQLAAGLAATGIASLRYSKRGYDNPAELPHQTMTYIIRDAASTLRDAKAKFPGSKVFLVGFSEGALVATAVAAETPVDALFLMGLPTRSIDELLAYQFLEWPVDLIESRLDQNHDGLISGQELSALGATGKLPLLGPGFTGADWQALDANHDGTLSVQGEVVPDYEQLYSAVMGLVQSPQWYGWYSSLRDMTPFPALAKKITAPVFLYEGQDDAQVKWSWVVADRRYFGGKTALHLFPGLGHCFSPMDGMMGEIKTSGPIESSFFAAFGDDLSRAITSK